MPIVSNMPKDNHSVMQLYLDGFTNNFYIFFVHEKLQNCKQRYSKFEKFLRNKDY